MTDLELVAELIRREKSFVIATHVQPDGDGIGSLLGLGLWLRKIGKEVSISWGEEIKIPPQYYFLPGINLLSLPSASSLEPTATFIAVDCASIDRLGVLQSVAEKAQNFINIDHHPGNTRYGKINLIDEKTSSSAELVYQAIKSFAFRDDTEVVPYNVGVDVSVRPRLLDHDIALCLYTGIVTDTGRFQYSNTNENTFKIALELLQYGISPNYVFQNVYENSSFSSLQLLSRILDRAKVYEEASLIYTSITQHDLKETGTKAEETENFIDHLRAVQGAEVAVIFKEMPDDKIKVSLRSKNETDVGEIARKFGGGGHRNAAGFTSDKNMEETLKILAKELGTKRKIQNLK